MLLAAAPLVLHAEETAPVMQPIEEAVRAGGSKTTRFVLTSGETVIGRIVRIDDDALLIRRPSAGLLSLPLTQIAGVKIKARNGKFQFGKLMSMADGSLGWLAEEVLAPGLDIASVAAGDQPDKGGPLIRLNRDIDAQADLSTGQNPDDETSDAATADIQLTKLEEPSTPTSDATKASPGKPVRLSVTTEDVSEGGKLIYFRLTLSEPASQSILIIYTMINGSATAPGDYTHRQGVVVFEPGQTETVVATSVIDDDAAEGEENFTFFVTGDPANVLIEERKVTATIADNDG